VRYDTRGNGLADRELPSPPDLDALVDDLSAVIDSLPENDAIELWGSTYGGPIALTYAARHPERVSHLILDGTYARGSDILPGDSADQFLEMLDLARHQPNVVYSSLSYMTDPEPQIGHDARVRRLRRSIDPDSLVDLYRLGFSVDVSRLLPTIHMPTLVLHRTRTRSVPFREGRNLAAELPNAKLVALEGRAHNLWEEQPAAALSAIGEFLGIDGLTVGSPHLVAPAPVGESVVVMFTDICGSTELTSRLGDDAAHQIVRAHNTVVRRSITRFGSKEIKHTGDGIFASFRSATSALGAAAMIQSAASDLRHSGDVPDLAIRIGLNAGEPIVEEDDLFGSVVQIAARVCSVASPDEVLVTSVVKELAAGRQFRFLDRCDQSLRGVADPVHLWALARPTTNRPDPISVP
jgi:class 3 adenylate cyclase